MLSEDSKRYLAFDTTILTPWRKGSQPCFQDLLHLSKDSLPVHIEKELVCFQTHLWVGNALQSWETRDMA